MAGNDVLLQLHLIANSGRRVVIESAADAPGNALETWVVSLRADGSAELRGGAGEPVALADAWRGDGRCKLRVSGAPPPDPTLEDRPVWDTPELRVLDGGADGGRNGRAVQLPAQPGAELVIGRGSGVAVAFRDDTVSRRHARVFEAGGEYFIEDLGSTWGTEVNGRGLQRPQRLVDRDQIRIGNVRLEYVCFLDMVARLPRDEPRAAPPAIGGREPKPRRRRPLVGLLRAAASVRVEHVVLAAYAGLVLGGLVLLGLGIYATGDAG